jgi:hypothetical protein
MSDDLLKTVRNYIAIVTPEQLEADLKASGFYDAAHKEASPEYVPNPFPMFCGRCNFGPLMSWEKRDVGCGYCEKPWVPDAGA